MVAAQDPADGFYLALVTPGAEGAFITAMLGSSFVAAAFPDLALEPTAFTTLSAVINKKAVLSPVVGGRTDLFVIDIDGHGDNVDYVATQGLKGTGAELSDGSSKGINTDLMLHEIDYAAQQAVADGNRLVINISAGAPHCKRSQACVDQYTNSEWDFLGDLADRLAYLPPQQLANTVLVVSAGNGPYADTENVRGGIDLSDIIESLHTDPSLQSVFPPTGPPHMIIVGGEYMDKIDFGANYAGTAVDTVEQPNMVYAPDLDVPINDTGSKGNGTSLAAPKVANVIARVFADNPDASYDAVIAAFEQAAKANDYFLPTVKSVQCVLTLTAQGMNQGMGDGGMAPSRWLGGPFDLATDCIGNIYVSDSEHTIRKITPAGVITTLAGSPGRAGSKDGTGSAALFGALNSVAVDGTGNLYVADTDNNIIRKITQAGVVTTVAGSGKVGSKDGIGSTALFGHPGGVAVDGNGNVYVADTDNSTIRKITPAGVVTTLAGSPGKYGSTDGTGSTALFGALNRVAVDGTGNLYVADTFYNTIRKITPAGVVTTLAGSPGKYGSTDGIGSAALFSTPVEVAVDGNGNLYVTDFDNDTIRMITPMGLVTTLAGSPGMEGSTDGIGSAARFTGPSGVAVDGMGNVYVADSFNPIIRKITPAGVVTTLPAVVPALFDRPTGVAVDGTGNLYVGDTVNNTIRKITPAGVVTILAGSPPIGGSLPIGGSADGSGSAALFNSPTGMAVDGIGNLYVADFGNDTIRMITPTGLVTTLAGSPGVAGSTDGIGSAALFNGPTGVAVDGTGNLYVTDSGSQTIRRITPGGVVTTLAGSPGISGSTDGKGCTARFQFGVAGDAVSGMTVDNSGTIYVGDTFNNTIRRITPTSGTMKPCDQFDVTTLAGSPGIVGSADGTGGAALFNNPSNVAVDGMGNVYVADSSNAIIRKITSAGVVTTLAGSPGMGGSADGTRSAALFGWPAGVAVDGNGNVYVADTDNSTIRKITPAGVVTTLAGIARFPGSTGGPHTVP